jgi:hypothetical protein
MSRSFLSAGVVVAVTLGASALASAEPQLGERPYIVAPPSAFTQREPAALISPFIYLNRCVGGCPIVGTNSSSCAAMTGIGQSDARANKSGIPAAGNYTITEFANGFGQKGVAGMGTCLAADGSMATPMTTCTADASCITTFGAGAVCDTADYEWNLLVKCMKEVYSPYNVTLQDTIPGGGVSYTEAVIGGQPSEIGCSGGVLGIAPLSADCSAQDNVISFSFANAHGGFGIDRINNICWTAAQETAHAFGLDHEYSFVGAYQANMNSACMDPMTYRIDCGGEKFFRDAAANCGEFTKRDCRCGGTQNSHQKLLTVFGAGTPITAPPHISIVVPSAGAMVGPNFTVQSKGGAQRGIAKVELSLNGYVWTSAPGAAYGPNGQADPSSFALMFPNGVPDSNIDIVVKAFDDINTETDSATISVVKGAPCTSATTCAKGQQCDAQGRCFWTAPTGQLGDACTYDQFCTSGSCVMTSSGSFCSMPCVLGVSDACPAGYDCVMATDPSLGDCIKHGKGGGCCSASTPGATWAQLALAACVLVVVTRRRRRA